MENFRRAIGIKIKEMKEVFEGQVMQIVRVFMPKTAACCH